jgi:hypothetical protein
MPSRENPFGLEGSRTRSEDKLELFTYSANLEARNKANAPNNKAPRNPKSALIRLILSAHVVGETLV